MAKQLQHKHGLFAIFVMRHSGEGQQRQPERRDGVRKETLRRSLGHGPRKRRSDVAFLRNPEEWRQHKPPTVGERKISIVINWGDVCFNGDFVNSFGIWGCSQNKHTPNSMSPFFPGGKKKGNHLCKKKETAAMYRDLSNFCKCYGKQTKDLLEPDSASSSPGAWASDIANRTRPRDRGEEGGLWGSALAASGAGRPAASGCATNVNRFVKLCLNIFVSSNNWFKRFGSTLNEFIHSPVVHVKTKLSSVEEMELWKIRVSCFETLAIRGVFLA